MSRFDVVCKLLDEGRAADYAYGRNDCFMLGMRVIDALRGTEFEVRYRGRYRTLRGAKTALRKEGHTSIVGLLRDILDAEPIGFGSAVVGDVAVCEREGREHMTVFGGNAWHAISAEGDLAFTHADVKAAFKV
ncbi:MAG: hypothetical protein AAGG69_00615 [Pseudomonadota bacterium]